MKIEPAFTTVPLNNAAVGSVIQYQEHRGFVALSQSDKIAIWLDEPKSQFVVGSIDPSARDIQFVGETTLKIDMTSSFFGAMDAKSRNEVYMDGETPFIFVQPIANIGMPLLLNMATGILQNQEFIFSKTGFRKWGVYVRDGDNLSPLLECVPITTTKVTELRL